MEPKRETRGVVLTGQQAGIWVRFFAISVVRRLTGGLTLLQCSPQEAAVRNSLLCLSHLAGGVED